MKMTEKEYAQLASHVYDRKDIRNKMTLPEGVTELEWQDDDKWTGFSAGVYQVSKNKHDFLSGCLTSAFPLWKTSVRQPESYIAVGWALAAHAFRTRRQPENAWA